jgi:hypothetical protein
MVDFIHYRIAFELLPEKGKGAKFFLASLRVFSLRLCVQIA